MGPRQHLRLLGGSGESEASDEALFLRAAADEAGAFERLVERYERRLRRYVLAILRDQGAAEEATQEVFLRAWNFRKNYRARECVRSLLFTIARNHCCSILRRRRVLSWIGLDASNALEVGSDSPSADERVH